MLVATDFTMALHINNTYLAVGVINMEGHR